MEQDVSVNCRVKVTCFLSFFQPCWLNHAHSGILKGFVYTTLGFKLYFFPSIAAGESAESIEKRLHSQANRTPNSREEFIVILFRIIFFYRTVITSFFAPYCRLS